MHQKWHKNFKKEIEEGKKKFQSSKLKKKKIQQNIWIFTWGFRLVSEKIH